MLVLPNAWDAASARSFENAWFPAIATSSGAVANALGYADGEAAPVVEMLAAAQRIIRSVVVPVTVDFEAGYGLSPAEIAERLVEIGAAGLNLEDTDHHNGGLVPAEQHAERLAAFTSRARALGVDLVLNARVDVFIRNRADDPERHLEEGLRRARLYQQAGADCIYPITLSSTALLAEFVKAVGAINVNVRRDGPLSLAQLAALGVRRVSYATSLYQEAQAFIGQAATAIREEAEALPAADASS